MMEKLGHIRAMGFNAVELMPIHEFNELEYYSLNPATGEHRFNFWGYSTVGYNAPMVRQTHANKHSTCTAGDCYVKDCMQGIVM